ncbi:MAG: lysophospholipid acyltransferase family protein [Deltaproteobacteria bacterium]
MRYTIFDVPVLRNVLQAFSIIILRIFGWRREGRLPDIPKFVMIAAPHTSNWDFPIALAIMFAYKMNLNWLGKDSLFRWPFGGFFKWLGGIPINRSKTGDVVAQSIKAFKDKVKMVMVIAPEGTRKKAGYWKTGFYHIANGANIPIVMGFLDYVRKVGGIGPSLMPTGNIDIDLKSIQEFYANITGKFPEKSVSAMIAPRDT